MTLREPPSYFLQFDESGQIEAAGREGRITRTDGYQIGGELFDLFFASALGPALADLVEVAVSVYAADRMCRRRVGPRDQYRHAWHRQMDLTVPVRDPELWNGNEMQSLLGEILTFLSDDDWTLRFRRHRGPGRAAQGALFNPPIPAPRRVALFSGGLDSFAGVCSDLLDHPEANLVLMGAWTNSQLKSRQEELLRGLVRITGRRIVPVLIPFGLKGGDADYNDDEYTQRTRGFVHGILGAAVALSLGEESVACYENGIGALNLPLNPAQLGAQSSRSAHPVALHELSSLIEHATKRAFRVELPFLFQTKGRVCRRIAELGADSLVPRTVSCDSFLRRIEGEPQCGACTSCLLRRQALKVAGLPDPSEGYGADVHGPLEGGEPVSWTLQVMLDQVRVLESALASPHPWSGLVQAFPVLDQTVYALGALGWSVPALRHNFTSLLRSYCSEWEQFHQQTFDFVA